MSISLSRHFIILLLWAKFFYPAIGYALENAIPKQSSSSIVLVENGQTNYQIILAKDAFEGVSEAALELQRLIKKSTGTVLPINSVPNKANHYIFIGESSYSKNRGFTTEGLESDSYFVKVVGQDIFLIGKDDDQSRFYSLNINQSASAGSYYAVLDFSRRFLGARWYMPGKFGEEIDSIQTLTVPIGVDVHETPHFAIRYLDIASNKSKKRERQLRKINRLKGKYYDKKAALEAVQWGRHLRLGSNITLNVGHAWYQWLPAEKPTKYSSNVYGLFNPEFYAKPGGGKQGYYLGKDGSHGGQLCVCNPNVAEVYAGNVINYAKKTGERNFSLSHNDGKFDCSCSCCKKNPARFLPNTPELSGEVIKFANKIVDKVVKKIPDANFGLYAYSWLSIPPVGVKAREEIIISDVYNGLPYLFSLPEKKAVVAENILKWREFSQQVVFTTYYTFYGHYSLPWSTVNVQAWMLDLLLAYPSNIGVRMNYALLDMAPMGTLGADPWVLSNLLWNPDQSILDLESQYYNGAFGDEAGPVIQQYFLIINHAMSRTISQLPFKKASGVKSYIIPAYNPIRNQCRILIEQAIALVSDKDFRYQWRVDRVVRAWQLTEITLDMLLAEEKGKMVLARKLANKRRLFLKDKQNIFALARASNDHQQTIVPLLK